MQRGIQFDGRPVWAEIRLSALAHNLRAIRRHVHAANAEGVPESGRPRSVPTKLLAVVKGNAYGHGVCAVATTLSRAGADWFWGHLHRRRQ